MSSSSAFTFASLQLPRQVVSAMAAASMTSAVGTCVVPSASFRFSSSTNRSCCCATTSYSSSSSPRPPRLISVPSPSSSSSSSPLFRPAAPSSICCQASPEQTPAATGKIKSILCTNCEGNGAVICSQCQGEGLNTEDHFQGRFKAGTICWLCRGKKQMLCGNCNGAGFMGGFLNTQDD